MGCTVRIRCIDGTWESPGRGTLSRVAAEGIQMTWNEWGPDTCSFSLRRDPTAPLPDLTPSNWIEIIESGITRWEGRIGEVPTDTADGVVRVQGKGWQYHADDDLTRMVLVHTKMTEWKDWRSNPAANLSSFLTVGQVEAGDGLVSLTFPAGSPTNGATMSYLDAGTGCVFARVVAAWSTSGGAANRALYFCSANDLASLNTAALTTIFTGAGGATGGTFTQTLATPSRYIAFRHDANSHTPATDEWVKLTAIQAFASTAYESGNASILEADEVIKLARADCPLLSSDDSLIDDVAYSIPDFAYAERRTPRQHMEAANSYHDYLLKIAPGRRLMFTARPTGPKYVIGAWPGIAFRDSTISAEAIYNRAYVTGEGPDGQPVEVQRDASGTIPTRQGYIHTLEMPVQAGLTTAVGERLGDLQLANRATAPFKGEVVISPGGVRPALGGAIVNPIDLGADTGCLIRFTDRLDPDTGGRGRDGKMVSVAYDDDNGTATVSIDNDSRRAEALIARYTAVAG